MGPLGGPDLYPAGCERVVGRIEFNSDEVATQTTCGNQGRPGAAERIKNKIAPAGEAFDQRQQRRSRLLCRVDVIAGIAHLQDIRNRALGTMRLAFSQQVRLLMLVAKEAHRRGIALSEYQVADEPEARHAPRRDELVRLRPAVKANAEAIRT